jgi:hypothetical protein
MVTPVQENVKQSSKRNHVVLESNMKARNILFLAMFTVILFFVCQSVFAQDAKLQALLKDKVMEYQGTCRVDAKGFLVFDDEKTVGSHNCVVGAVAGNDTVKWVLLLSNDMKPYKLIKFTKRTDKTAEKQEVAWVNPRNQI